MKTVYIILAVLVSFILSSCNSSTQTVNPNTSNTISGVNIDSSNNSIDDDVKLLKKYRKEGFINADTYSITIVRPSESSIDIEDIRDQAKKRTLVSFQKYVRQRGNRVNANVRSSLLNLINNYGSMKKIQDNQKSRVVFVYIVKKDNLKHYVDNLK